MVLCLLDLNGGHRDDAENTDEWIHLVNRGRLRSSVFDHGE